MQRRKASHVLDLWLVGSRMRMMCAVLVIPNLRDDGLFIILNGAKRSEASRLSDKRFFAAFRFTQHDMRGTNHADLVL